jgi:parallel beta-helix repeat protein
VSGANDPGRYRSVNGGLACMSPGDTLKIKNGIYNYSFPTNPIPSGISQSQKTCIVGESRDGVIFRPDSSKAGIVLFFSSGRTNICFRNMTLDGVKQGTSGTKTGIRQGGPDGIHHNWDITDMTIKNFGINLTAPTSSAGGNGIALDGGGTGHYLARLLLDNNGTVGFDHGNHIYWRAAKSIIEHSVFTNHSRDGLHMYSKSGSGVDNNIIRYNRISGSASRGINIRSGVNNLVHDNIITNSGTGIYTRRSGNKILNNTVYGSSTTCIRLEEGPLEVRNNIFLNCGRSAIQNYSAGSTIINNLTSGKASDIFINPDVGDFTLKTATGVGATITTVSTASSSTTVVNFPAAPGNLQAVTP